MNDYGIKELKPSQPGYPDRLKYRKYVPDLYYLGESDCIHDKTVAIIGKRNASTRMLLIAERIGKLLAQEGYTVVNGLAIGVDQYAIKGALSAKGKCIGVMPSGLDQIYPKSSIPLADGIVSNGGCLLSEYKEGTPPAKFRFVERDYIQACLADKVIVVDCDKKGGTMHTITYAMKNNIPVCCYLDRYSSDGNIYLTQTGRAYSISDTDDLLSFLREPVGIQEILDLV